MTTSAIALSNVERRSSQSSNPPSLPIRFPSPGYDLTQLQEDRDLYDASPTLPAQPMHIPKSANGQRADRWMPRREASTERSTHIPAAGRRGRQKSIGEALRTIKQRRGSVSDNVHEIADALKAPLSPKLVLLCGFWFMTSIFSNASSKAILTAFRYPVTLTLIQFAFVSSWCIISSILAHLYPPLQNMIPALKHKILPPSRPLILTTLPLALFQVGGHILNSDAMSRVPVSLVHTIKGLSPLFTVIAYRIFFHVRVSVPTYLSLIPLTLGVIMACSANLSGNFLGLLFAFGSTVLFVTQNIVSKKLFNEADRAEAEGQSRLLMQTKPDKLNLLCYSSALAFLTTAPLWLWSEGFTLLGDVLKDGTVELSSRADALDHGRLALEFLFNGTFHFAQSLVAFVLLSMVSPVTYSVASLIKRVFVICFAIVWFGNPMTRIQAFGILLTFVGLYLYDRTNDAAKADRHAKLIAKERPILPLITENKPFAHYPVFTPTPTTVLAPGFANGADKKEDPPVPKQSVPSGMMAGWMPRGTRQEHTWREWDMKKDNKVPVT